MSHSTHAAHLSLIKSLVLRHPRQEPTLAAQVETLGAVLEFLSGYFGDLCQRVVVGGERRLVVGLDDDLYLGADGSLLIDPGNGKQLRPIALEVICRQRGVEAILIGVEWRLRRPEFFHNPRKAA